MTTQYVKAPQRREQLLETACKLAEATHYREIRRHHLVEHGGTAAGNVSRVLGSMDEMRDKLIQYAIDNGRHAVVAQAIIDKHPLVAHLDQDARRIILGAVA